MRLTPKSKDFHWKTIFNKPEVRKTKTLIEKCIFNRAQTKNKDFIVTIRALKTIKIHMKKGTTPSSTMPEAKKTKTLIEKSIQYTWNQKNKDSD